MSFTPENEQGRGNGGAPNDGYNFVAPKHGSRRARISLIVDLGTQERADLYELDGKLVYDDGPGVITKPQKPCQQVAVFADLIADTVDYGGDIGKAHYRMCLNKTFQQTMSGINFTKSPPKDAKGKDIPNKPWSIHPQNLLTKIANAVGKPEVAESADISQLLNEQVMVDVQVKETDSGKKDKEGNDIVYRNVNFKGVSKVAAVPTGKQNDDGDDIEAVPEFAALKLPAQCITFTNAKKEDIKYLRKNVIKMIKLAKNYQGSAIQKAIEAFEGEQGASEGGSGSDEPQEAPEAAKEAKKAVTKAAPKKAVVLDDGEDLPFFKGCRLGNNDPFRGKMFVI